MVAHQGQKFVVDSGKAADQQAVAIGRIGRPLFICNDTAGFFEKQQSRCNVIGLQIAFPEPLQKAGGDIAQIQSR